MKQLWNALIARLVYGLTPKPPVPPEPRPAPVIQAPEPPLKPGVCECEHIRCIHIGGKGQCTKGYPKSDEWPDGAICACEIFIPKKDDPPDPQPETPSPSELEELYRK